jgi:acyl-CoA synthetase (AMP-forming)/AMP-acid ligase II
VHLPLNSAYTLAELDYFIADAEPKLAVCDLPRRDGIAALASAVGAAVETLDAQGRGSLMDERGYVHIVGRGKDLIISGGFNVYPKEVETEIDALPGVVESAVIGAPHPDFSEGAIAAVVPENGTSLDEAAILAVLTDRLARFKLPKRVIAVDELPRNTMGKVQKNVLRELYKDLFRRAQAS